jgi:hypothetical protein
MANLESAGAVVTSYANVNDGDNATFTVVAGAASKYTRLHRLVLSSAGADNLTVKFGVTTILGPIYVGANSNFIIDFHPLRIVSAVNAALTVTKGTSTTDVTAFVQYTQEY